MCIYICTRKSKTNVGKIIDCYEIKGSEQARNECRDIVLEHEYVIVNSMLTRAPLGGGGYFEPPSRFLAISSKPMQVSSPILQYPLSQHFYTLC